LTEPAPAAPPRVSVIMPAYQARHTIAAAICSVLAQTERNFELIIVDDGGADSTLAIARSFADPRIRIISQANRGLAGARNTGIAAARAPYIALLDSDDLFLPGKLGAHLAHLDSDPTIGASFAGTILIGETGRDLGISQTPKAGPLTPADMFFGRAITNGSVPVLRAAMLAQGVIRTDRGGRAWYFDETLRRCEDLECWTRLALRSTYRFASLPGAYTRYRISPGSLSADIKLQLEGWEQMCAAVSAYAPDFIATHRRAARARMLRYFARRCVFNRDRRQALVMIVRALRAQPMLIVAEPRRTGAVVRACLAMWLLPPSGFLCLARLAGVSLVAG
jgi:glycosyltransferase involved in cell wall biosynthesis